jgi:hypothetical protein
LRCNNGDWGGVVCKEAIESLLQWVNGRATDTVRGIEAACAFASEELESWGGYNTVKGVDGAILKLDVHGGSEMQILCLV